MDYKDFGEYLYDLRIKNNLTYEELTQKIDMPIVTSTNIKKWERDLEFPNLDTIYKLSEIFEIPSEELLKVKEDTLNAGTAGINKRFIRWLSFFLGISIYSTIILSRVIIYLTLILVFIWFVNIANNV